MSETVQAHLCGWMVLQRADGTVLLARRSGVRYGEGLWGLPGGHAGLRESWGAAAVRETSEEVGVTVDPADVVPLGVQRYVDGEYAGVDAFFRARRWRGQPAPVSECSEVAWWDPARLPTDTLPWLGASLHRLLAQGAWLDEQL